MALGIESGKTHQHKRGFLYKDPDRKIAYVTIPKDHQFEWPELFSEAEKEKLQKKYDDEVESSKKVFEKATGGGKKAIKRGRQGLPSFFGL